MWTHDTDGGCHRLTSKGFKQDMCSTNNKNPETEIGVQPENQKSKATKPLAKSYLYQGWVTAN